MYACVCMYAMCMYAMRMYACVCMHVYVCMCMCAYAYVAHLELRRGSLAVPEVETEALV